MSTHLAAATRCRAEQSRERARVALRNLDSDGASMTYVGVAKEAGVSRPCFTAIPNFTWPGSLRRVDTGDEAFVDLEVMVGFDDDLAGAVTRISNRIRGLLTQVHPALERVLGLKVQHPAAIELLACFGGRQGIRQAIRRQLVAATKPRERRSYEKLIEAVIQALTEQVVTVPGVWAAELVLPKLATTLAGLLTPTGRRRQTDRGGTEDGPNVPRRTTRRPA